MDILHFVDRLENIVRESRTLPLSRKLLLDEEKLIEIEDRQNFNERQLEKYGHYKL